MRAGRPGVSTIGKSPVPRSTTPSSLRQACDEQAELVDTQLGGVAIAHGPMLPKQRGLNRLPWSGEDVTMQVFRLLQAHELITEETHEARGPQAANRRR